MFGPPPQDPTTFLKEGGKERLVVAGNLLEILNGARGSIFEVKKKVFERKAN